LRETRPKVTYGKNIRDDKKMEHVNKMFYFIRHKFDEIEVLEYLMRKKYIAISYSGDEKNLDKKFSCNPNDYPENRKEYIIRFNNLAKQGGIVFSSYHKIYPQGIVIGDIPPDSKVRSSLHIPDFPHNFDYMGLKILEMKFLKERQYADYPLLLSAQPIKQTFSRWNNIQKQLPFVLSGENMERESTSLSDQQLELVCTQYLIETKKIDGLLIKVGHTMPAVDVIGFRKGDMKKIFVQVTHESNDEKLRKKFDDLNEIVDPTRDDVELLFFGKSDKKIRFDQWIKEKGSRMSYIGTSDLFRWSEQNPNSVLAEMINRMVDPLKFKI